MKKFSKFFKMIDIFGTDITFEHEESNKFKTVEGSMLSLAILTTTLVVGIMFGQEIYERKRPMSFENKERIQNSEVFHKEFPLMFNFHFANTTQVPNIHNFIEVFVEDIVIDSKGEFDRRLNMTQIVNCKKKADQYVKFNKEVKEILSGPLHSYCLNFNEETYFKNDWLSNGSRYQIFHIFWCIPGTRFDCLYTKETFSSEHLVVALNYPYTYIDNSNYNSPVSSLMTRYTTIVSEGLLQIINFKVGKHLYLSDDGWILENERKIEYDFFEGATKDVSNIPEGSSYPFYSIYFESPQLRTKNYRSYLKVQELFARVGGIANSLILIFSILTSNYFRFKYLLFFRTILETNLNKRKEIRLFDNKLKIDNIPSPKVDIDKLKINKIDEGEKIPEQQRVKSSSLINSSKENRNLNVVPQISQVNSHFIHIKNNISSNINDYLNKNNNLLQRKNENNDEDHQKNNSVAKPLFLKDIEKGENVNLEIKKEEDEIYISDLFIKDEHKFDHIERISYLEYLTSTFCSCFLEEAKLNKYNSEIKRLTAFLDIRIFKKFLADSYINYYGIEMS